MRVVTGPKARASPMRPSCRATYLSRAAPPPKGLVEVKHGDIREVGHARHRLQKPKAGNRPPIERIVEEPAQHIVRYEEDQRRLDGWPQFLASPHGIIGEDKAVQLGAQLAGRVGAVTITCASRALGPVQKFAQLFQLAPKVAQCEVNGARW